MNERTFEIGDKKFKLSKIDAFKQFHIVRRLGPVLGEIIPIAQKLKGLNVKDSELSEDQKLDAFAQLITPIMNGLSKLSDDDANLVLKGLLSAVEIHQPQFNTWARVASGDTLMIQDLSLPLMLQIAGRAFAFNLADFFIIAPQVSHGQQKVS